MTKEKNVAILHRRDYREVTERSDQNLLREARKNKLECSMLEKHIIQTIKT